MSKQAIQFLADESCDFAVVRALRAAGHDVKAIAEVCPGVSDEEVVRIGIEEGRVLLTEDKVRSCSTSRIEKYWRQTS